MVFPMDPAHIHEKLTPKVTQEERPTYLGLEDIKEHKILVTRDLDTPTSEYSQGALSNWTNNGKGCSYFVNMLTCVYALVITIVGLVMEISPQWRTEIWIAESVFFFLMYGFGLLFFIFVYLLMIYTGPYNFCIRVLQKYRIISPGRNWTLEPVSHTGEGAGTLYLRLGALLFGGMGIVMFGLEIYLCINTYKCYNAVVGKHILAIIFTFYQMHFIFVNTKMTFPRFQKICKFGLMHLVAINLWTWMRFVVAKQTSKASKKSAAYATEAPYEVEEEESSSSSSEEESTQYDHLDLVAVANETIRAIMDNSTELIDNATEIINNVTERIDTRKTSAGWLVTLDHFGGLGTVMTTCLVEYSLIGAAVAFILWRSIGHAYEPMAPKVKRKHNMRIDCSSSLLGIFAGLACLVAVIVACGAYSLAYGMCDEHKSWLIFGYTELAMFIIGITACMLGLYRMRLLQYRLHAHGEVIDEILLVIGFFGELIYCALGVDIFITAIRLNVNQVLPIFVFAARFAQVVVQTMFILTTSRLRCLSGYAIKNKPGKQFITFLLLVNISLFVFHTYESTQTMFGVSPDTSNTYLTIIYAIGPLLIFYRFHSSACMAEIWKITYSTKSHHKHSTASVITNLTPDRTPIDFGHRDIEQDIGEISENERNDAKVGFLGEDLVIHHH